MFLIKIAFISFWACAASCVHHAPPTKNEARADQGPAEILRDLKKQTQKLSAALRKKDSGPETMEMIAEMRGAFSALKKTKGSKGDPELLRQYCEAGLGLLMTLEKNIQHSFWDATRNSLAQLRSVENELRRDFKPSPWERFKHYLQNLF